MAGDLGGESVDDSASDPGRQQPQPGAAENDEHAEQNLLLIGLEEPEEAQHHGPLVEAGRTDLTVFGKYALAVRTELLLILLLFQRGRLPFDQRIDLARDGVGFADDRLRKAQEGDRLRPGADLDL